MGGTGKDCAIDLDELHPGQQLMKSLSALRDLLIRETSRDSQAVDRAETFDLQNDTRNSGLNGIPLSEWVGFAKYQTKKNRGIEVGDHLSFSLSSSRSATMSVSKGSGGGRGTS
ncbi:MAG: hypothetical protein M3542_12940 [Acidobacteriota bacterium]|nr:hypothetical protein [Acidobacteriota bacterium]